MSTPKSMHTPHPVDLTVTGWRTGQGRSWGLVLPRRRRTTTDPARVQWREVLVRGGYLPAEIHVNAGLPARLVFRREETAACSEQVVFPDLGISAMLPPYRPVVIDLPSSEPGEHPFRCQMDMLHGRVIVDPPAPGDRARHADLH